MKVNTTTIFSVIWFTFLVFFLIMGYQSLMSVNTELPRYSYEAPKNITISIAAKNIPEVLENITKTHNAAVTKLEKSIISEAKTMTSINFVSAFMCFLGLLAQIADGRQKNIRGKHKL